MSSAIRVPPNPRPIPPWPPRPAFLARLEVGRSEGGARAMASDISRCEMVPVCTCLNGQSSRSSRSETASRNSAKKCEFQVPERSGMRIGTRGRSDSCSRRAMSASLGVGGREKALDPRNTPERKETKSLHVFTSRRAWKGPRSRIPTRGARFEQSGPRQRRYSA